MRGWHWWPPPPSTGERAGRLAAGKVAGNGTRADRTDFAAAIERIRSVGSGTPADAPRAAHLRRKLQALMWENVGAFRDEAGLDAAIAEIRRMRDEDLPAIHVPAHLVYNTERVEWFELRGGLDTAEAIAVAARERRESRGAHQRTDYPETRVDAAQSQKIARDADRLVSTFTDVQKVAA